MEKIQLPEGNVGEFDETIASSVLRVCDGPGQPGTEDNLSFREQQILPAGWETVYRFGDEFLPRKKVKSPSGAEWLVAVRPDGTEIQPRSWYEYNGKKYLVNANGNVTVHPTSVCNASCEFCSAKNVLVGPDVTDEYFKGLEVVIDMARRTGVHTISISGGEPSLYGGRLLRTLRMIEEAKRDDGSRVFDFVAMHSQGTGLLRFIDGVPLAEALGVNGLTNIGISRISHNEKENSRLMLLKHGISNDDLRRAVEILKLNGVRTRFSCAMLAGYIDFPAYMDFAKRMGVEKVLFRVLYPQSFASEEQQIRYNKLRLGYDEAISRFEKQLLGARLTSIYKGAILTSRTYDWRGVEAEIDLDKNPSTESRSLKTVILDAKGLVYYSWVNLQMTVIRESK